MEARLKVVGTTWENRRALIADIAEGTLMEVVPEPGNTSDPNAIAVRRQFDSGESATVGYLPAGFAAVRRCDPPAGFTCKVGRVRTHPDDGQPVGFDLLVPMDRVPYRQDAA